VGVVTQMKSFKFYFGIKLGQIIFGHCDNLSRTLQHSEITAAEGQSTTSLTVSALESIRSEEMFNLFWDKVMKEIQNVDVGQPVLPRARKVPKRFETSRSVSSHPDSPKSFYRIVYFEVLDLVINAIKDRFDQPGYEMYKNLQEVLLKASHCEEYSSKLQTVMGFYGNDFEPTQFSAQLQLLSAHFRSLGKQEKVSFKDIAEHLQSLSPAAQKLYSQVIVAVSLVVVMPATNAASDRSFFFLA